MMSSPSTTPPSASTLLQQVVPDLGPLAARMVDDVDRNALIVERDPGIVLFDEGNPCKAFLLLDEGVVRVSRRGPEGRELLLYRVKPGETCVLTLSCLLGKSSYPARGVVEHSIHGILLPGEVFEGLMSDLPQFRRFIYESFADRLAGVLDLASAVAFDRLDQRLAEALLQHIQLGAGKEVVATHQQLADEIGSVRERVSRLLESFEASGTVELGRGRVVVRDEDALRRVASRQA